MHKCGSVSTYVQVFETQWVKVESPVSDVTRRRNYDKLEIARECHSGRCFDVWALRNTTFIAGSELKERVSTLSVCVCVCECVCVRKMQEIYRFNIKKEHTHTQSHTYWDYTRKYSNVLLFQHIPNIVRTEFDQMRANTHAHTHARTHTHRYIHIYTHIETAVSNAAETGTHWSVRASFNHF